MHKGCRDAWSHLEEARMPVVVATVTFKLAFGATAEQYAPVDHAMKRDYISSELKWG
jgi:hypothetical protein